MLSLIAGPETGAAQGTPIRLVNYDVYPDGTMTTASLVSKAILEAAQRHQQEPAGTRGVICLATSSQSKGASMTLEMAVDYAVDLYAPGENVNVVCLNSPASGVYDLSNGTSPATALTAAAALVELSYNPSWQAEEVEKLPYHNAYTGVRLSIVNSDTSCLVQMGPYGVSIGGGGTLTKTEFEKWAETVGLSDGTTTLDPNADSDGDGRVDLMEFIQGSDPQTAAEPSRTITYEFEVNPELFDATNPHTLLDGTGWEIQCSCDMRNWVTVDGGLEFSATEDGRVRMKVAVLPETPQCFLRIVLTPASAQVVTM